MGGYGALLLAERYPEMIVATAAISPAVWTSYAQARAVNPGAYASAGAFAAADAVTHAGSLRGVAVRVAAGAGRPVPSLESRALVKRCRRARSCGSRAAATPARSSSPSSRRPWPSWPAT